MANPDFTSPTVEIQLTKGYVAIVDAEDMDEYLPHPKWISQVKRNTVYAGRIVKPYINRRGTSEYLHVLVLERVLGRKLVRGEKVDHINGNGLDNRRSNLRLASHAQNIRNSKKSTSNKTGFKGVMVLRGLYVARITVNAKSLHLGSYDTALDAAIAYNFAAVEYFGEYARLNEIDNWQNSKPRKHKMKLPSRTKITKSGYAGVYFQGARWSAHVFNHGRSHSIGLFDTPEEANTARQEYLKAHQD